MESHLIHYTVDGKPQSANVSERTPVEILQLAGEDPSDKYLIEIKNERRESYHDHPHRGIKLHNGQTFESSRKTVHFKVDDEIVVSREHELTPNKIMELAGVDPKNHYLVRLCESGEESFRDKAETSIHVNQHDKFITLLMGATPVS
jgi:hypothetical protein